MFIDVQRYKWNKSRVSQISLRKISRGSWTIMLGARWRVFRRQRNVNLHGLQMARSGSWCSMVSHLLANKATIALVRWVRRYVLVPIRIRGFVDCSPDITLSVIIVLARRDGHDRRRVATVSSDCCSMISRSMCLQCISTFLV